MDYPLNVPSLWNLSRKHFRVSFGEGRFIKLNHFENRLTAKDLKFYCWKLKPMHVYLSVLNWLFPERVGKKYKARYCVPLNGEYVIDVDAYLVLLKHKHKVEDHWFVCEECLDLSARARFDDTECIGEEFVLDPTGGAIAYFESTRHSYSGADSSSPYCCMGEIDRRIYENF